MLSVAAEGWGAGERAKRLESIGGKVLAAFVCDDSPVSSIRHNYTKQKLNLTDTNILVQ